MNKKLLIFGIMLMMIPSIFALELTAEVDVNWKTRYIVEIEVSGGDSVTYNCTEIDDDNYQDFDETLEVKVREDGKRYESEVDIEWDNEDEFVIETDSNDFSFDCSDVDSDYNDFDDNFEFTFKVDDEDEISSVEDVVKRYLNFTGEINVCVQDLATCDVEKTTNYDKWLGCEEEGGAYKNEVQNLKKDVEEMAAEEEALKEDVNEKEVRIASLEGQVSSCNTQKNSLQDKVDKSDDEIEDAKSKASSNLLIGAVIAGLIVWFVNKKDSDKPPEEQELYQG